jgi:hypothetical protein
MGRRKKKALLAMVPRPLGMAKRKKKEPRAMVSRPLDMAGRKKQNSGNEILGAVLENRYYWG